MRTSEARAGAALLVGFAMVVAGSCARQTRPEPAAVEAPTDTSVDRGRVEDGQAVSWRLSSTAFEDGALIPADYTCSGKDTSPPLRWTDPPDGTVQLALICSDPDAPAGDWVHWVIYAIPANVRELPAGDGVEDGFFHRAGFTQHGHDKPVVVAVTLIVHESDLFSTFQGRDNAFYFFGVPSFTEIGNTFNNLSLTHTFSFPYLQCLHGFFNQVIVRDVGQG